MTLILEDKGHTQRAQLEEICNAVRANVPGTAILLMHIEMAVAYNDSLYRIRAHSGRDWMSVRVNSPGRYEWDLYRWEGSGGPDDNGTDTAWGVITRLLAFADRQPMEEDWYRSED